MAFYVAPLGGLPSRRWPETIAGLAAFAVSLGAAATAGCGSGAQKSRHCGRRGRVALAGHNDDNRAVRREFRPPDELSGF